MQKIVRGASALMLTLICAGPASAQATRTWVSGVGDDVNPCSRTAPCKTFAGAISKTAAGGVISVLDPGGFGAVTITKAITIDGGGTEGSITMSGAAGVIINAGAGDQVTLRNLTIFGVSAPTASMHGVRVLNAGRVNIENVLISGFMNGIENASAATLNVERVSIRNCASFGIHVLGGRATLKDVRLDSNTSDGVRARGGSKVVVRGGATTGHMNLGYSAFDANTTLTIEDSVVSNNAWGIGAMNGGTVIVSNTVISSSMVQGLYSASGGSLLTFGNNRLAGNTADGSFTGSLVLQ